MKIFRKEEIQQIDIATIKKESIASIDLMERASITLFNWIKNQYGAGKYAVFVGVGNNGGDGLALARLLSKDNRSKVKVYIIGDKLSKNAQINLDRLREIKEITITPIKRLSAFNDNLDDYILIDGLFGYGLTHKVEGIFAGLIQKINNLEGKIVISIDLPSGLMCDDNNISAQTIIKATHTLTFEFPKLSLMFSDNIQYIGDFHILPIGLDTDTISNTKSYFFYLETSEIKRNLRRRKKFAHKGFFGHALLIAGETGKIGACILAAKACVRTGVGLLSCCMNKEGFNALHASLAEAMVTSRDILQKEDIEIWLQKFNAIAIGPGINISEESEKDLCTLLTKATVPLVLDADALNILARNKNLIKQLSEDTILTPHSKEFERLVGKSKSNYECLQKQIQFSIVNKCYIVLKGPHTSITCPDGKCYFNSTGNQGMATGGSGDVLTGIILSLLAQGYSPKKSCIIGVYLHGLAGDIAAKELGYEYMTPSDNIKYLKEGFKFLNDE